MANEEKLSRTIITGMADSRLNTAHLAWLTKMDANGMADKHLKEFFYFYQKYRNMDDGADDLAWLGGKMMEQLDHPDYGSLASPPPPGTRIVFADEM